MHRLTLKTEISTDIKLKITEMRKFYTQDLKRNFSKEIIYILSEFDI